MSSVTVTFIGGPANLTQRVMRDQEICRRIRIPGYAYPYALWANPDEGARPSGFVEHTYELRPLGRDQFAAVYDGTQPL